MVTAISRYGIGPDSELVSSVFIVGSSVIIAIPRYLYTSFTSELYNITVVCIIHPDSTADHCAVKAMANGSVTRTGTAPFTNGIAAVIISDIQCAVTYTITAEGMLNGTLVGPGSSHGNVTAESCPTTGGSESEDDFWIIIVTVVGGGMLVINILTVIIISLYCKHRYNVNKDYKLPDNDMNIPPKTNSAYCSLPTKDAPEKKKEIINATYTPSSEAVTLGGDKALDDIYNPTDTDYVTVKNTANNSADNNMTNVTGADVQMKPNPSYNMHLDRKQIESAVYVAPYKSTTEDSAKPVVYNYAYTTASDVTTNNGLTRVDGNIELNDIPTYGNVAIIKMNANIPATK